ncbi:helix-turn-helix domain-containing protein [Propionibacteriaceae bacterium G1746]|uniref:helix-turn-helix domain-containing protein n=1 Tax=Aestuariimicrobium sp. G57 TaxID=3418485 RepID=UPI003C2A9147
MQIVPAGARVTGQARSDLAGAASRHYAAGASIRGIAAQMGRSYGFVQKLLVEQGVTLRGRGGDTRSVDARVRRAAVVVTAPPVDEADASSGVDPDPKKTGAKKSGKAKKKSTEKKSTEKKSGRAKKDKQKSDKAKSKGKGKRSAKA